MNVLLLLLLLLLYNKSEFRRAGEADADPIAINKQQYTAAAYKDHRKLRTKWKLQQAACLYKIRNMSPPRKGGIKMLSLMSHDHDES